MTVNRAAPIKTLKIDGRDVSARQEETILEVARQNNIFIPTLCELKGLPQSEPAVSVWSKSKVLPACCLRA